MEKCPFYEEITVTIPSREISPQTIDIQYIIKPNCTYPLETKKEVSLEGKQEFVSRGKLECDGDIEKCIIPSMMPPS